MMSNLTPEKMMDILNKRGILWQKVGCNQYILTSNTYIPTLGMKLVRIHDNEGIEFGNIVTVVNYYVGSELVTVSFNEPYDTRTILRLDRFIPLSWIKNALAKDFRPDWF